MIEIASSSKTMASSSSVRRPSAKRAAHTWPIPVANRSHFEDFLEEIGATTEACHLCCIPRQGCSSSHHSPARKTTGSSRYVAPLDGTRQSQRKARGTDVPPGRSASEYTTSPSGRTQHSQRPVLSLPIAAALGLRNYPSVSKSGPVSATDLQIYEPPRPRPRLLSSAQESLRSLLGDASDTEAPPRASAQAPDADMNMRSGSTTPETANRDTVTSSAPSTRSVSRSPSSSSLSTVSSSEAPATPRTHISLMPEVRATLADLEEASRFRVQAACTTCGKRGANFPSCAKCGETWCSRDCRLQGSGGRRHACARRAANATA